MLSETYCAFCGFWSVWVSFWASYPFPYFIVVVLVTKLYSDSFVISLIVACQTLLSLGFSRQKCKSGWSFLSLGDLLDAGINAGLLHRQVDPLPHACSVASVLSNSLRSHGL